MFPLQLYRSVFLSMHVLLLFAIYRPYLKWTNSNILRGICKSWLQHRCISLHSGKSSVNITNTNKSSQPISQHQSKKGWLRLANTFGPHIFNKPAAGIQSSNKQFQKSNFSSYNSPRIRISDIPRHYKQLEQQNNAVILEWLYEKKNKISRECCYMPQKVVEK